MTYYGYFSPQSAKQYGYHLYERLEGDRAGEPVAVTCLGNHYSPVLGGYPWDDAAPVGTVGHYIGSFYPEDSQSSSLFRVQSPC